MSHSNPQPTAELPSHYKTKDGRIIAANPTIHKMYAELELTPWPQGHGATVKQVAQMPEQTIHTTDIAPAAPAPAKEKGKPGPKPKAPKAPAEPAPETDTKHEPIIDIGG